jgi:NAD(P)-dependent dehydrogenase (short-subunit alcohol dehydrogenase family)
MVLTGTVRGSDPRAKLVGRDAYLAGGGRIERELFDNADTESWVDVTLLESLAAGKMEEEVAKRAPLRRNVEGSDVGGTAAFLCSDLSAGITGEVIYVDCGINTIGA